MYHPLITRRHISADPAGIYPHATTGTLDFFWVSCARSASIPLLTDAACPAKLCLVAPGVYPCLSAVGIAIRHDSMTAWRHGYRVRATSRNESSRPKGQKATMRGRREVDPISCISRQAWPCRVKARQVKACLPSSAISRLSSPRSGTPRIRPSSVWPGNLSHDKRAAAHGRNFASL